MTDKDGHIKQGDWWGGILVLSTLFLMFLYYEYFALMPGTQSQALQGRNYITKGDSVWILPMSRMGEIQYTKDDMLYVRYFSVVGPRVSGFRSKELQHAK